MHRRIQLLYDISEINAIVLPALKQTWLAVFGQTRRFDSTYALGHWYCHWVDEYQLALLSNRVFTYPLYDDRLDHLRHLAFDSSTQAQLERALYQTVVIPVPLYENEILSLTATAFSLRLEAPLYSTQERLNVRHPAYYQRCRPVMR
jgi:hypothetical protein